MRISGHSAKSVMIGYVGVKQLVSRMGMSNVRRNWPRVLHFLLRYSDSLRRVDTYSAHKDIEERFGFVWWGKFGVGIAREPVEKARGQIQAGTPTYVYLATKKSILYRGRLLDI